MTLCKNTVIPDDSHRDYSTEKAPRHGSFDLMERRLFYDAKKTYKRKLTGKTTSRVYYAKHRKTGTRNGSNPFDNSKYPPDVRNPGQESEYNPERQFCNRKNQTLVDMETSKSRTFCGK